MATIEYLLENLHKFGGGIFAVDDCGRLDIAFAKKKGLFTKGPNGECYVYIPRQCLRDKFQRDCEILDKICTNCHDCCCPLAGEERFMED